MSKKRDVFIINQNDAIGFEIEIKKGLDALLLSDINYPHVEGMSAQSQCDEIYDDLKNSISIYKNRIEIDANIIKDIAWEFNLTDFDLAEYIEN
ncbi:MAG: hypothetical protein IJ054_06055 [Lachnospiraceae bacterium]|nr:hypothetical protein [Lachnospiraceae bacterium]